MMMMGRPQGNRPAARPGGAGFMGMGMPVEKSKDFRGTLRRLLGRLRPERVTIAIVALLASASVAFSVVGPKLIGNATNVIFEGIIGKTLPAGMTKDQAVEALRSHGQSQLADMLSGTNVVPGAGVDFTQLAGILASAAAVYVLAAVLGWLQTYLMAGVAQRTVYGMRRDVEAKLARLPLRYFDSHAHGDLLSRVTNDVDNIATTLQQGMSQLLTSLLTVIGVLGMMLCISTLLAVISILMIPLSLVVTVLVAGRSQRQFVAQWARTGVLNGHVEQMHTGHALVKVFGRRQSAIEQFDRHNQALYEASFAAQFLSGIIQPAMGFLSNLNYVGVAVIGGYRVASGAMTLGDVQAFIQYSRQFTMPLTQLAAQANLLQSGLASAERVFEFLMAPEEMTDRVPSATRAAPAGSVSFARVSFRYRSDKPLIEEIGRSHV